MNKNTHQKVSSQGYFVNAMKHAVLTHSKKHETHKEKADLLPVHKRKS